MAYEVYTKEAHAEMQQKKKDEIKKLQAEREKDIELYNNKEFAKLPNVDEIIQALRVPCKVELVKEEDFVIRSFLRHGSVTKIVIELNKIHPDMKFHNNDIKEFLVEYQQAITKEVEVRKKSAIRRILKTKEGLTSELLDLAELAKKLATKYDGEGDHTSAISAIKAAADIFFRNAKLEGLLDESTTININTQMDKLVQNITTESSSFKEAVMSVIDNQKKNSNYVEAEFEEFYDGENGENGEE